MKPTRLKTCLVMCPFMCRALAKAIASSGQAVHSLQVTFSPWPDWTLDIFPYKYSHKSQGEGSLSSHSGKVWLTLCFFPLLVCTWYLLWLSHHLGVHHWNCNERKTCHYFLGAFWVSYQNPVLIFLKTSNVLKLMCWWHQSWGWYGWWNIK